MNTASKVLLFANGQGRDSSLLCDWLKRRCGIDLSPIYAWLSGIFGIDLRSLAVFRIGLGLLLLTDILLRFRDLVVFYTDLGAYPRAMLGARESVFIFHYFPGDTWYAKLSGTPQYQATLFTIAAIFAVLLTIGCWTRVVTVVSWLMLLSVQARNPPIMDGAQDLLRLLLLWSIFLPLGARYSVDAAMTVSLSQRTRRILSMATVALGVQLWIMYWISYKFKMQPSNPAPWIDGSAVWYALQLDMLVTPIGVFLRDFPSLLRGLTHFVMWLEMLAPVLFYFLWPNAIVRIVLILLMCGMHAGFALCMWIEIFPFVCVVAWLAFTPTVVWDMLDRWLRTPRRQGLALYFDGTSPWSRRWALLARTFLALPRMRLRRLAVQPAVVKAAQGHSLILTDARGGRYVGSSAVAEMMRRSPVAWPLGWLAAKWPSTKEVPQQRTAAVKRSGNFDWLAMVLPIRRSPLLPTVPPPWYVSLTTWLLFFPIAYGICIPLLKLAGMPEWAAFTLAIIFFPIAWPVVRLIERVIPRFYWGTFVAVGLLYTLGYNLNTVGITAIDFGALVQSETAPGEKPRKFLSDGVPLRRGQWNFMGWMTRPVFWPGNQKDPRKQKKQMNQEIMPPSSLYDLGKKHVFRTQWWSMFAPRPLDNDGWFIVVGRLQDGRSVDLWTGKDVDTTRPNWPADKFPNYRWFKFMERILNWRESDRALHINIGNYYIHEWNKAHPNNRMLELNIFFMVRLVQPSYLPSSYGSRHIMQICPPGSDGIPGTPRPWLEPKL